MSFVSEEDRAKFKADPKRPPTNREKSVAIIDHHFHTIETKIKSEVGKAIRQNGSVYEVKIFILHKGKIPDDTYAEQALVKRLRHEHPEMRTVAIKRHWWNPPGGGMQRYDITVTFRRRLK